MARPERGAKVSSCHSTLVRSGTVSDEDEVSRPPLQPPMAASVRAASASGPRRRRHALAGPLVDGPVAPATGWTTGPSRRRSRDGSRRRRGAGSPVDELVAGWVVIALRVPLETGPTRALLSPTLRAGGLAERDPCLRGPSRRAHLLEPRESSRKDPAPD